MECFCYSAPVYWVLKLYSLLPVDGNETPEPVSTKTAKSRTKWLNLKHIYLPLWYVSLLESTGK